MNINKIRIANLKRIIFEDYNNSIHRFAKTIGRHSSQFYNLFKGDRSFGQKLARDLELLLNLETLSLDKSPDENNILDKIVLIPSYHTNELINTNLTETTKNIFAIEKSVIECNNWQIDALHGFIMHGESMSPTIPHNGKVLIDISQTKIDDGKIYTLSKNGDIFIKRVFRQVDGTGYEAKSDNEQHESICFTPGKEVNVIGRVLCILNKML